MQENPTLLGDTIGAEYQGEEITIWNSITVKEHHNVNATQIETHHRVLEGDGSTGESPEYITPEIESQLRSLDIYPYAEVVDPRDDEVTIL